MYLKLNQWVGFTCYRIKQNYLKKITEIGIYDRYRNLQLTSTERLQALETVHISFGWKKYDPVAQSVTSNKTVSIPICKRMPTIRKD